jgi:hypothetical protein
VRLETFLKGFAPHGLHPNPMPKPANPKQSSILPDGMFHPRRLIKFKVRHLFLSCIFRQNRKSLWSRSTPRPYRSYHHLVSLTRGTARGNYLPEIERPEPLRLKHIAKAHAPDIDSVA